MRVASVDKTEPYDVDFSSLLTLAEDDGYLHFDEWECRAAGKAFAPTFRAGSPFPHIVIDDFLDRALLRRVAENFPPTVGREGFDRDQERKKFQFHPRETAGFIRNLFAELNSQAFLAFLEEMTGIEGLIVDPYYEGAGLHLTQRGGHLGIHTDFNMHGRMHVERRLNLILYLNDDWADDYGGNLELWDQSMTHAEKSVSPILGRAVIFATSLESFHGHPDPLACPVGRGRQSIAIYYYTAARTDADAPPARNTVFRVRPGSTDAHDARVATGHFIDDWVPRRLQRPIRRLIGGR